MRTDITMERDLFPGIPVTTIGLLVCVFIGVIGLVLLFRSK